MTSHRTINRRLGSLEMPAIPEKYNNAKESQKHFKGHRNSQGAIPNNSFYNGSSNGEFGGVSSPYLASNVPRMNLPSEQDTVSSY